MSSGMQCVSKDMEMDTITSFKCVLYIPHIRLHYVLLHPRFARLPMSNADAPAFVVFNEKHVQGNIGRLPAYSVT